MAFTTLEVAAATGVLVVTLNRPATRNAMSLQMVDELRAVLAEAEASGAVRVIVLRGAGGHFCAGADFAGRGSAAPSSAGASSAGASGGSGASAGESPASTTHGRISDEARARAGITDGLLRVAVGLESVRDIEADLARGLGG